MARPQKKFSLNQVFGRLTVIKEVEPKLRKDGYFDRYFECFCECNNIITIKMTSLTTSRRPTRSCGCKKQEVLKEQNVKNITHGLSDHPLYATWNNIHRRCYNKEDIVYSHYGAKGITVCKRWHGSKGLKRFIQWAELNGWKSGLEIDRRNGKKRYCPENCRWVTRTENNNNKENNLFVTLDGKNIRFSEIFKKYGHPTIKYKRACFRLHQGWNALAAVSAPKNSRKFKAEQEAQNEHAR